MSEGYEGGGATTSTDELQTSSSSLIHQPARPAIEFNELNVEKDTTPATPTHVKVKEANKEGERGEGGGADDTPKGERRVEVKEGEGEGDGEEDQKPKITLTPKEMAFVFTACALSMLLFALDQTIGTAFF